MKRILEKEKMIIKKEINAYKKIVQKHISLIHHPFANFVSKKTPSGSKILDIGTGTGEIVIKVAEKNPLLEIYALDISQDMLKIAKESAQKQNLKNKIIFINADAKFLPFGANYFDTVISHNFLHHIENPQIVFSEIKRVLKKKGKLIIRDLRRPSKFLLNLLIKIYGIWYDKQMKKLSCDSIHAALNIREIKNIVNASCLKNVRVSPYLITHYTISGEK